MHQQISQESIQHTEDQQDPHAAAAPFHVGRRSAASRSRRSTNDDPGIDVLGEMAQVKGMKCRRSASVLIRPSAANVLKASIIPEEHARLIIGVVDSA